MQSAAVRGGLLSEAFFDACAAHPGERKNYKNHFCVDCAAALCRHCLSHDPAHDVLTVRLIDRIRSDALVKHLGESEQGLTRALRENRQAAAGRSVEYTLISR